ncbi:uncharacterized protein PG986_014668 [Apiospora aurea]|uniref:Uncharacterized protein n=1 Tax=Apiospora aurea TaxID=335848 RepID=A0ABR1PTM4_9PEZI
MSTQAQREASKTRSSMSTAEDNKKTSTRQKATRSLRRRMRDWRARMRYKSPQAKPKEPKPESPSQAIARRSPTAQLLHTPPSLAARCAPADSLRSGKKDSDGKKKAKVGKGKQPEVRGGATQE